MSPTSQWVPRRKTPNLRVFRRNDLVVFRLFFFPSPHIPGKVPAGPRLPANVGAPSSFPPGRFSQPDFTNRRVSIHRCPGTVYETWTWPFEKLSIFDPAVAVGAPFCSCPRPGAPYIRRPPPLRRANQSSRPPVITHAVDSHLAVAGVSSDGASGAGKNYRRSAVELAARGGVATEARHPGDVGGGAAPGGAIWPAGGYPALALGRNAGGRNILPTFYPKPSHFLSSSLFIFFRTLTCLPGQGSRQTSGHAARGLRAGGIAAPERLPPCRQGPHRRPPRAWPHHV